MEREVIKEQLLDVLSSKKMMSLQIDVTKVSEETSLLNDIALDSIQLLEFIVGMESKFGFGISSEELCIDCFDKFSSIIDFVQGKMKAVQGEA